MNKIDLFYGFIIGILTAILGIFLFIFIFTDYEFLYGVEIMQANKSMGKLVTVGAVLNLGVFFLLLKLQKELVARGVILATILLAIVTIFL